MLCLLCLSLAVMTGYCLITQPSHSVRPFSTKHKYQALDSTHSATRTVWCNRRGERERDRQREAMLKLVQTSWSQSSSHFFWSLCVCVCGCACVTWVSHTEQLCHLIMDREYEVLWHGVKIPLKGYLIFVWVYVFVHALIYLHRHVSQYRLMSVFTHLLAACPKQTTTQNGEHWLQMIIYIFLFILDTEI